MPTCERCGKNYTVKTISEKLGKHYCRDCTKHCSVCGRSLPMSNWFGQDASLTGAVFMSTGLGALGLSRDMRNASIGSGMCNECFYKEKEKREQAILAGSSTLPPPPPNMCSTCGHPLRYIQQYQRWYCDNEKKYV